MTFQDIVDFYKNDGVRGLQFEFARVKLMSDKSNPSSPYYCPNSLVRKCFLYYCVRGGHQYRMQERDIYEAAEELQKNNIARGKYKDFEDLYDDVKKVISPCHGIAELTVYDTALRLGYHLGVLPNAKVYLTSGGFEGYKRMTNTFYAGRMLVIDRTTIVSTFPELSSLTAYEIEDFFCVCKDFFEKADNTGGGVNSRIKPAAKCQQVLKRKKNNLHDYTDWYVQRINQGICVTHG